MDGYAADECYGISIQSLDDSGLNLHRCGGSGTGVWRFRAIAL